MKPFNFFLRNGLLMAFCAFLFSTSVEAQCGKFNESTNEDDALAAHSLYRDDIKINNFEGAFANWKKAYELAPAADGKRHFHYSDGRAIYMNMLEGETDEAKKKEYIETILRLYDEQIQCYGEDGEEARLLGRKAFDMFYTFRTPYSTLEATLKDAVAKGGNKTEYIVFMPYASLVEFNFSKDKMSKEDARSVYTTLNEIADHNIENNEKLGAQYKQAKDAMNGVFAKIEDQIFDCDYFKDKLVPKYRENPDDLEVIKYVYNKLKSQGCDPSLPVMVELDGKYSAIASQMNAEIEVERRRTNPGYDASMLQKEGNFTQAISRYKEAIAQESDPEAQAQFYYTIGYLQAWKLKEYSNAKSNARKAADLKGGWGKPYALLGDVYAKQSSRCGDDWEKRLAIIAALAKYEYARSIDPSVDVGGKISTYRGSLPESEEGFMRGVKAGQTVTSKCTGEAVKVRFK